MTSANALGRSIEFAPSPYDRQAATLLREAWGADWNALRKDEAALVEGVAGCSPFLRRLMQRAPERTRLILQSSPNENLNSAFAHAQDALRAASTDDAMRVLREAKAQAALATALADIAGARRTMEAADDVSQFAGLVVDLALTLAARKAGAVHDAAGIAAIAMGKLGAAELNYSSDIDLVIVYDAEAMGLAPAEAKTRAVRVARDLVAILQNQTADGYVFRTDLRLRPDPGVSPLALSVQAAETYYESFGQNWERMAYIKARALAGDIGVGEKFLAGLRPFVWRKYLDFAAIEDVKAVKRQLHSAKGGKTIEFAGHDLKLGRGGIREIEFFVQTQQVILGGKDPSLRARATLDALEALNVSGQIDDKKRSELSADYIFLRHVEHRLQMINDEQTHRIPSQEGDIMRLAAIAGDGGVEVLRERLMSTFARTAEHFDELFREETEGFAQPGPLVFTGVDADPQTVETLQRLGFQRPEEISRIIRRWHAGGVRATKSERARRILTRLMAPLLTALARASDPDAAFFAFDQFLSRLPAGVQFFSLLANNVALFDTLIEIMTMAPFLGGEMSKRSNFVESLIAHGLSDPLPSPADYVPMLERTLEPAGDDYERVLNLVRRWAGEERFFIAAKLAAGKINGASAARALSAIADAVIAAIGPAVKSEMKRLHGVVDGALIVLAMGRLGAQEMTIASDIDILFVYDAPEGARSRAGDGQRVLDASEYFSRQVRRFVTALSASTEEGALYEVDMALRPSGRSGPAAVSLAAFRRYYREEAWTWELMALTKARVIAGERALALKVETEIDDILKRSRDASSTAADVDDMRLRLLDAKPGAGSWDVKRVRGGLTDIAFIVQYLALVHAGVFGRAPAQPAQALSWFAERGIIDAAAAQALIRAHNMQESVMHAARAATGGVFEPAAAGPALASRMAQICGAKTLAEAGEILQDHQAQVLQLYQRVLGRKPPGSDQA